MISIRRHLLVTLVSAIALGLLTGAYGTYRLASEEASELFDYHLRQLALSLRDQSFSSASKAEASPDGDHDFVIQVWDGDGRVSYVSDPKVPLPKQDQPGFTTVEAQDGRWRIFSMQLRNQTIQVAHPRRVRDHLAAAMATRMLAPFVILLPVLAFLIWWIVGRGLTPLTRIAGGVIRRAPGALHPLSIDGVPREALPLVTSLNDLLARLDIAISSQRNFVADAAHELRTPLTALQLQVQLARRAISDDERKEALDELGSGLERASHVVQQLLTLARQEPGTREDQPKVEIDVNELAAQVVADHLRLAESRGIDLGVAETATNAKVRADADAMRTLVANLIDNALRYTPTGGRVDVIVRREEASVVLEVCDSGPGIPAEERERVFDRFYRHAGTGETGSGLGLAIVRAIAERHGATIHLGAAQLGGLSVMLRMQGIRDRLSPA